MGQKRFDIQLLRGIAVLVVVLFHAFPWMFPRGFLGVDIFFVISGFLITTIILKGLDAGSFSFRDFYIRRARRLLPANFVTLVGATGLAFLLLTHDQLAAYAYQLLGVLTFSANFVLASQTGGYFDPSGETRPLLHLWSLAVEEQFYFVAPLLLWLTPLRARPLVLVSAAIFSFALCCILAVGPAFRPFPPDGWQKLAFFMLPTRAWEILAGSICAWLMLRRPSLTIPRPVKLAALCTVVLLCCIKFDPVHPRGDAFVIVAATALMILGRDDWLPDNQAFLGLARLGDWSYSLYLVHWPLFSFAYISFGGPPPLTVAAALILLSLALAWLQFTFVEERFRRQWKLGGRRAMATLIATGLLLGGASLRAAASDPAPAPFLKAVPGLAVSCDQKGRYWLDQPECRTSTNPAVALWGDSFAMHLAPGLKDLPLVQLTRSACAPVLGISHVDARHPFRSAEDCIAFHKSAIAAIERMPSVKYVVISSPFGWPLADRGQSLIVEGHEHPWRSGIGEEAFVRTIQRIQASGRVPIIVAPPPMASFDAGRCNQRKMEGLLRLGHEDCDIPGSARDSDVVKILRRVAARTDVQILEPGKVLCSDTKCRTPVGGKVVYRDDGHLTEFGSTFVVTRTGLRSRLGGPPVP